MSRYNWSDYGIAFETEAVAKRAGPNNSDKRTVSDKAQIAVIVDLQKFLKEFGEDCLLAMSDGTSLRVKSQGLNRAMVGKSVDEIQDAHYNLIKGIRRAGRATPMYPLPDGSKMAGDDWTAYQAAYMAQLVDMGMPGDVARNISLALQK
jgi:hypothetical protein